MERKVIIICPNIPPNPGIGGRRWAKFAKYLLRLGRDVSVYGFKYTEDQKKSNWCHDIQELEDQKRLHLIPHNFPEVLRKYPTSISKKVAYRVQLASNKVKVKGNYYDPSIFWSERLIPILEKEIKTTKKEIVILATGAPFTYLNHLIPLKEKYGLKLIADFRDPWTENEITYGYKNLPKNRLLFEKEMELAVFNEFDALLNVYNEQDIYVKSLISDHAKCHVIPNGYDPEDLKTSENIPERKNGKIRFVFAGTLYNDAAYGFDLLIDMLDNIEQSDNEIYQRLEFVFFGNMSDYSKRIFGTKHAAVLKYEGFIPLNEVYSEIRNADFSMVFFTKEMNYTMNTKFLECINLKRKILIFSNEGFITDHVESNEIGYAMTPEKYRNSFQNVLEDYKNGTHKAIPLSYDTSNFDVQNLTQRISDIIDSL